LPCLFACGAACWDACLTAPLTAWRRYRRLPPCSLRCTIAPPPPPALPYLYLGRTHAPCVWSGPAAAAPALCYCLRCLRLPACQTLLPGSSAGLPAPGLAAWNWMLHLLRARCAGCLDCSGALACTCLGLLLVTTQPALGCCACRCVTRLLR